MSLSSRRKAAPHPTGRLLLRPWRHGDKEAFRALNACPQVMKCFPAVLSPTQSDELYERIQAHFDRHGFGLWVVELRKNSDFVGVVGLTAPSFPAKFMPCVEIGWRLVYAHWGRGYATEAARAVLAFGFEALDLEEVVSFTAKINLRSRWLMKRLGMRACPEEDFDHPKVAHGSPLQAHALYRLTNVEFQKMSTKDGYRRGF